MRSIVETFTRDVHIVSVGNSMGESCNHPTRGKCSAPFGNGAQEMRRQIAHLAAAVPQHCLSYQPSWPPTPGIATTS